MEGRGGVQGWGTKLIFKEVLIYYEEVISECHWSDGCYSKSVTITSFREQTSWRDKGK
jgi:hypothetical protein